MSKSGIIASIAAVIAACFFLILFSGQSPPDEQEDYEQASGTARSRLRKPKAYMPDDTQKPPVDVAPSSPGKKAVPSKPGGSKESRGGGAISGMVSLPDSDPAKGAKVVAVGFAGRGSAITDKKGVYRIARLRPGKYTVSASLAGFAQDMRQDVAVTASEEAAGIDFTLLRGGVVEGTLLDESGESVAGEVCISGVVQEEKQGQVYRCKSAENGKFRIEAVMPGRYRMEVFAAGYLPVQKVEIEVFDGQTERTETTLKKGAWISGTVVNESGEPVRNAEVQASPDGHDGPGASAMTDGKGGFTLKPLAGGSYSVKAMHDDYTGSVPVAVSLTAGKGAEGLQVVLLKSAGAGISGRVVSKGRPVEGAAVEITSKDFSDSAVTDSDGRFSFSGVENGVDMTVKAQGYKTRSLVGVRPGKTGLTIEIEQEGFPVSGKVTLEGEKAVSNITIRVFRIDGETGQEVNAGSHPFFEKFPEFSFAINLPVGEYRLRFTAEGYESQDRTITVAGGGEEINLSLAEKQ